MASLNCGRLFTSVSLAGRENNPAPCRGRREIFAVRTPPRRPLVAGCRLLLAVLALGMLAGSHVSESVAEEPMPVDLLRNGLDGWTVDGPREVQVRDQLVTVWTHADGVLSCCGRGFPGFLRYEKELADFRLSLEYRFPQKGGNSGIGIRTCVFTGDLSTRPSTAAYEVQLLGDAGQPPSAHGTASLYRLVAPRVNNAKPAGEWNSMVIECRGPRLQIFHNEADVIDFDQTTRPPTAKKSLRGHVSLQNHGTPVEFRNIRLTELPER